MKILVTGAAGQLGRAIARLKTAHECILFDSRDLDITQYRKVEAVIRAKQPDCIVNAAAYTQVDRAESDEQGAFAVNAQAVEHLARQAQSIGARLIHISTDYVFRGDKAEPWTEDDQPDPLSVYGKSKLAGERVVREYCARYFIVRTAWLYHVSGQNFLRTIYRLKERNELQVVNDQSGSPTNADDLAAAIFQLIKSDDYGIYHLVNSGACSWYELAREFYRMLDIATPVKPVKTDVFPRPAPRPVNSVLGTVRVGGTGLPTWQDALARLVAEVRQGVWD